MGDNSTRSKILIVEDSMTQAMELQEMLERNDYDISIARNGVEALSLIEENKPAIVISDIVMPGIDGYRLCERIKQNESMKDIYVMLLTTLSKPQEVLQGLSCGADRFFTKPYDEDLLLLSIKSLLMSDRQYEREERGEQATITCGGTQCSVPTHQRQAINLLVSTYEAAVRRNDQLTQARHDLELLNGQLEAKVRQRTAALEAKNVELNIMSQQLWQTAKLATMGELAASVAHELNNPLATISLRVESMIAQITSDDSKRRALEVIEQEVDRMGKLVANLLHFSRRSQKEVSTVNICEEIDGTLELVQYSFRKRGSKVVREFAPDVPHIHADRQQLRQLFINLFTNSSDAMPQDGTLTIRVYAQEFENHEKAAAAAPGLFKGAQLGGPESRAEDGEAQQGWFDSIMAPDEQAPPEPEGNRFLVVEITDTGIGIPPEVLPKIMEPFFTTKPEGKGTGLGLPICRRIVREHNGKFLLKSEEGKGTSVRIMFPMADNSELVEQIKNEKEGEK